MSIFLYSLFSQLLRPTQKDKSVQEIFTFPENVCRNEEKWELEETFTDDERLEPGRRIRHHWVPEIVNVPVNQI